VATSDPNSILREAAGAQASGDLSRAEALCRGVLAARPRLDHARYLLGTILIQAGRLDEALGHLRAAGKRNPRVPAVHAAMAQALERLNRVDEAQEAADAALRMDPNNAPALLVAGQLDRRAGRHAPALERLARLESAPLPARVRCAVLAEKGQALDGLGRFDEAFASFAAANIAWAMLPEHASMDRQAMLRGIGHTREWIDRGGGSAWATDPPDEHRGSPVFLVGFPRSGTTLMEQMLGSHPRVLATDEKPMLPHMVDALGEVLGGPAAFPDALDRLDPDQIRRLRDRYMHEAGAFVGAGRLRSRLLVDKHPLNILRLAMVRRVFPGARVLMMLRDPRDACLSCFMQTFEPNEAMVSFQHLPSTAQMYDLVMGLWISSRDRLGLPCMEVRYEDLVAEPERTLRGVLGFLGLAWDDRVLRQDARATGRIVSTPSYRGVSEGIYTRAVGRWKNYRRHLAPVLDALEPWAERLGYEPGG